MPVIIGIKIRAYLDEYNELNDPSEYDGFVGLLQTDYIIWMFLVFFYFYALYLHPPVSFTWNFD